MCSILDVGLCPSGFYWAEIVISSIKCTTKGALKYRGVFSLCQNTGGAIMAVMCKRYKPIDKQGKENCPNCFRWTGIGCENHEALIEDWQTRKSDGIDRVMRSNRAVWIG